MTRPSADRLGAAQSSETARVAQPVGRAPVVRDSSTRDSEAQADTTRRTVPGGSNSAGERPGRGVSDLLGKIGLGPTRQSRTSAAAPERAPEVRTSSDQVDRGSTDRTTQMRNGTSEIRAPREGAGSITKDMGRLASERSPGARTRPAGPGAQPERTPLTRQPGSDTTRGAKDLSGIGARTDTRGKADGAPVRDMDTGRSVHIRNIDASSSSTVYTDKSVNIYGNNNVYINGDVRGYCPTPYGLHRYQTVIRHDHFGDHSRWLDCGGYFMLNWSHYSCGRVIGLHYDPYVFYGVPYYGVSYYYPGYHRKYVFFSVGGYWPSYYRYRRYYWYGCHPYRWYGTYVIDEPPVQPVVQNVYNITYETPAPANYDYYYDAATEDFSDVRQKIRQQAAADAADDSPQAETSADICFDQAVQLFAQGKYEQAVFKLRVAMVLEPDDIVLPFAYCQALFAAGDYDSAAAALRATLENKPEGQEPGQETVYYPRGLYEDEKVLQAQIAALAEAVQGNPEKADYQLLLGYQLLGSGRIDDAITPLHKSLEMSISNAPAMTLIKLLEQIKADQATAEAAAAEQVNASPQQITSPAEQAAPAQQVLEVAPVAQPAAKEEY